MACKRSIYIYIWMYPHMYMHVYATLWIVLKRLSQCVMEITSEKLQNNILLFALPVMPLGQLVIAESKSQNPKEDPKENPKEVLCRFSLTSLRAR